MLTAVAQRIRAWLCVGAVVVVVGVVPVMLNRDSFPLSTFPMFSSRRTTTEDVDTAVLMQDGVEIRLSPGLIAATDEVILAAAVVSNAIAAGTADQLCADIARRVHRAGEIQVVSEQFDSVRWYRGDRTPLRRQVHATCPAGGSS